VNQSQVTPGLDLVIITGAGRGIGRSIAMDMAKTGAEVLCISQSSNSTRTAHDIRTAGGRAESLVLDLADYAAVELKLSDWLSSREYARIGVILAAAVLGPAGEMSSTALSEWDLTFRINVLGNLAVVRAALPHQLENRFGRILFFAGGGAAYAYPIFPAYAASKSSLVRIVENLHEDLHDKGDFATAILAPGAVETDTLSVVRANGGYVRTTVGIEEPTAFAKAFITSTSCGFSGCFVHVRDTWTKHLNNDQALTQKDLWKLRRVE